MFSRVCMLADMYRLDGEVRGEERGLEGGKGGCMAGALFVHYFFNKSWRCVKRSAYMDQSSVCSVLERDPRFLVSNSSL